MATRALITRRAFAVLVRTGPSKVDRFPATGLLSPQTLNQAADPPRRRIPRGFVANAVLVDAE